jgi:hypothetical protein
MSRKMTVIFLFLIFWFTCQGCFLFPNIIFTKEKEIVLPIPCVDFPQFFSTENDAGCNIMFWNRKQEMEFHFLDRDLKLLSRKNLRRGQGPGEVQNPFFYGGDSNHFVIYDAPIKRYLLFDKKFNFSRYIQLPDIGTLLYSGFRYIPDRNLILDGFERFKTPDKSEYGIYLINLGPDRVTDTKKIYLKEFIKRDKKSKMTNVLKSIHFRYFDNSVFVLDCDLYRIQKINLNGEIVKKMTWSFKKESFSRALREKWLLDVFSKNEVSCFDYPEELWPACWIIPLRNGFAVGVRDDYGEHKGRTIKVDYFDFNLKYLGAGEMPFFSGWNALDGQRMADACVYYNRHTDRLYIIDENEKEEIHLSIWKVSAEKAREK